jgi:RNA polymerase sigma-70 factor (ECF subfamily)
MNESRSKASAYELALNERLLAGDPIAPAEAVDQFLEPLMRALLGRRQRGPDTHEIESAAIEALLSYVQRPEQYRPERASLFSFLRMSAGRDLANLSAKERRHTKRAQSLDDRTPAVELRLVDRNTSVEDEVLAEFGPELPNGMSRDEALRLIAGEVPDARDRRLLALVVDGERSTRAYAEVLEITHLPPAEQEREVKRHKDRLKKRLVRLRARLVTEGASGDS